MISAGLGPEPTLMTPVTYRGCARRGKRVPYLIRPSAPTNGSLMERAC
jgi:hypothetical protein